MFTISATNMISDQLLASIAVIMPHRHIYVKLRQCDAWSSCQTQQHLYKGHAFHNCCHSINFVFGNVHKVFVRVHIIQITKQCMLLLR